MPQTQPPTFSYSESFGNAEGDWLRVQPIMHIARTIRELGGNADQIFSAEGIPGDLFSCPDNLISLEAVGRLLEHCVTATHCEHFGLLLGAGSIGNPFGLLGEAIEHCADVGTAIAHLQQYYHLHDRGGMAVRTIEQHITSLGYIVFRLDSASLEQVYDTAIAVGMVVMHYLCGAKWRPTTVLLPRHRPVDCSHNGTFLAARRNSMPKGPH